MRSWNPWVLLLGIAACAESSRPCEPEGMFFETAEGKFCLYANDSPLVIEGGFACPPALRFRFDTEAGIACADHDLDRLPQSVCEFMGADCEHGALPHASGDVPAIATLRAALTRSEAVELPEGDVRLALVWYQDEPLPDAGSLAQAQAACVNHDGTPGEVGSSRMIEQQVEVAPESAERFTLALTGPPPDAAFWTYPHDQSGRRWASGTLKVYADRNGNGRLDERASGDAAPDVSLDPTWRRDSRDTAFILYYTESAVEAPLRPFPGDPIALEPGFNLIRTGWDGLRVDERVPLGTEITVELRAEAIGQRGLCEHTCDLWEDFECPAMAAAMPHEEGRVHAYSATPGFAMWFVAGEGHRYVETQTACTGSDTAARRYYSWLRLDCDPCTCRRRGCVYSIDATLPEPAGWPCSEYSEGGGPLSVPDDSWIGEDPIYGPWPSDAGM